MKKKNWKSEKKIIKKKIKDTKTGIISVNAKGYGFVKADGATSQDKDIFIPARFLGNALNNDYVEIDIISGYAKGYKSNGKSEGHVIRVISRAKYEFTGMVEIIGEARYVIPDEKSLPAVVVNNFDEYNCQNGDKVVVRISRWHNEINAPVGKIIEKIAMDADYHYKLLLHKYDVPYIFPEEVIHEADVIADIPDPLEISRRRDLRDKLIVTIDGDDSKDLDDAVSLETDPEGNYILGVHIADVSWYVHKGSSMDQEAFERGNSIYLIDKVIPMLPEKLSNNVCSLNPNEPKLTMSAFITMNPKGKVISEEICESVILSKNRLAYSKVNLLLNKEQTAEELGMTQEVADKLAELEKLAIILKQKRIKRGFIDLNLPEPKITIDENGKVTDVCKYPRGISEEMIEHFMLEANEAVARKLTVLKKPMIYRVHGEIEEDATVTLRKILQLYGIKIEFRKKIRPKEIQKIIQSIAGLPTEKLINTFILRSMPKASYSPDNIGHFGLAANNYTHFTSPIRRYSDLYLHRLIRDYFFGGGKANINLQLLPLVSQQTTERERIADSMERDYDKIKKAEFMLDKLGDVFSVIVTGIISSGIFVELENGVEGFVGLPDMQDDFFFDEMNFRMISQSKKDIIKVGDSLAAQLIKVNVEEGKLDFMLTNENKDDQKWIARNKKK